MKKKIVMVMYGMGVGGAELQFLELAQFLNKKYDLQIYGFANRGPLEADFINSGLNIRVIDYKSKLGLIKATIIFLKDIYINTPETIVSTSIIGNIVTYIAKKLFSIKKIISFQTIAKCMMKKCVIDQFILKRFDLLIAGSNAIKEYLDIHLENKSNTVIIHNWSDFSNLKVSKPINEILEQYNINATDFNIGCIARLHKQKGQKYLIQAMHYIIQKNIKVYFIGNGPEYKYLFELVEKYKLQDRIFFLGEQRNDYINLMSVFDVIVFPSLYEGLPRTLLDAMYMKKCILATNIDGINEVIEDSKNGLLVEAENPSELKEAIEYLATNVEKRNHFSSIAHYDVIDKFEMIGQLEKIDKYL